MPIPKTVTSLTCKANKDNYTIAFEGSVLYSDDSFYAEPNEIALKNKQNCINLHSNLDDIVKRKSLEVSMSRSEQPQTNTRNRLQKSHTTQLQRYPSGNNNTAETITIIRPPLPIGHGGVRKCSSLPNLRESKDLIILNENLNARRRETPQKLNVSQAISSSTVETNLCAKSRNLLPMCQMPISCSSVSGSIDERLNAESGQYQAIQMGLASAQRYPKHRCCCGVNNQPAGLTALGSHQLKQAHISGSSSSGSSNPPAFNLVKLFIKQKSSNCSLEDQPSAHTCMDVSSGCWPSSDANGSSSSSSLEQRSRKKSMNDSGKGSALSRHEEEADTKNSSTFLLDVSASTPKQSTRSPGVFHDKDTSSSSSGSLTATNSPAHRRRNLMPLRNPTLSHLANQHNTNSGTSLQSSDNTSEQLTQVFMSSIASTSLTEQNIKERKFKNNGRHEGEALQPISNASSSEMITRSMQTSCGSLSTRSSLSDRFRCVPPSFLEKLNNLGEERQAPIYVIYPNYALPDLGFVKNSATPDVIFSPFNYKMTLAGATSSSSPNSSFKKRFNVMGSSEEGEILMTMDYKHVVDWASLVTLLPVDYRRRLKHIPEVNSVLKQLESELPQKPLFCLTPAVRRNRPHICDCAQYFQKDQQTEAAGSSSSGSSQQPSSGYRGSSTLLTDSDMTENVSGGGGGDPLKPMYVYQYEQQRMDSGAEVSPKIHSTPQAMPRGILRKSSSAVRNKRNSMIEQSQQANSKLNKIEKRRSLQEPPYRQQVGSAEELSEVFEEEIGTEIYPSRGQPKVERLSRKDLDARLRAENFLSSLPRNELKYYAEIAAILESSEHQVQYDAVALKKEVSRVLSQQKKVSFNDFNELQENAEAIAPLHQLQQGDAKQRFATPPNSPNISMASGAAAALRLQNMNTRNCSQRDEAERRKLESNRFKRLQIQWELMSKESSMLKELANAQQTKSGASTPTSAITANAAYKSRIPRPVSYPAGKRKNVQYRTTTECNKLNSALPKPKPQKSTISPQNARITIQADNKAKTTRSPSRIVPPKRYSVNLTSAATSPSTPTTTPAGIPGVRARTPNSRVAVTAPNTPKRRVQSPRTIPRIR